MNKEKQIESSPTAQQWSQAERLTKYLTERGYTKTGERLYCKAPADRYEFANVTDDIFKNCKTIEEMCKVYVQLKKDLNGLFQQNVALKSTEEGE